MKYRWSSRSPRPPCWAHVDADVYAALMREIADEGAERYEVTGRVMGAEAVQKVNARTVPDRVKRGGLPRTLVYAVCKTVRAAHAEAWKAAREAYVAAGDLLRRWLHAVSGLDPEARAKRARDCGLTDLEFPLGTIAPLACLGVPPPG